MIFGDLVGQFSDICLTGEEKARKNTSSRNLVPTGDRTRGPLGDRCVCDRVPQRWTSVIIIIIIIIIVTIIIQQ